MRACSGCAGTGITPYSIFKATCVLCGGSGTNPPTLKPKFGTVYEGVVNDFGFTGDERKQYDNFKERHIFHGHEVVRVSELVTVLIT